MALLHSGKYMEAKNAFNQVLEKDSEFSRAYEARGRACMNLREYDAAIKDFDRFLNSNTSFFSFKADSPILRYKAECYLELGRYKDAISTLNQALRQVPSDKESLRLRAKAHQLAGEKELAQEDEKRLGKIRCDKSKVAEQGGFAAILTLSSDEAPETRQRRYEGLDRHIAAHPNDYVAIAQRARMNAVDEQHEAAIRDFSLVLKLVKHARDREAKLLGARSK
ncbi:MAG TPA: tetratricopeptide repeat protein [Candidatus Obscuribacterales bacterium]